MSELFLGGKVESHCGDCLDILKTLRDDSIDSCVTDPPYHLVDMTKRYGKPDCKPCGEGKDGSFRRLSHGFMGKQWDGGDIAFRPEVWMEVLRVLKPGGHLLAFGGDRTQHRMACAIEDAGFEIRGTIAWIFGSGFPKSLNVSKRMRESFSADVLCSCGPLDYQTAQDSSGDYSSYSRRDDEQPQLQEESGQSAFPLADGVPAHNHADLLADDRVEEQANIFPGAETDLPSSAGLICRSSRPLEDYQGRDNTLCGTSSNKSPDELTAARKTASGKSDTSRLGNGLARYPNLPRCEICGKLKIENGLGTALKPAMEMICLARKPLSEPTVVANVLKCGTGAINIDACRVPGALDGDPARFQSMNGGWKSQPYGNQVVRNDGRWPANVIHDGSDEVVAGFPETGRAKSGERNPNGKKDTNAFGDYNGQPGVISGIDDEGGSAARFFYTAKADSNDRLGSKHPTVKPLDLMQYLVRLVTPKGGVVLDPFAGTGTTGEAAWREGMRAVLIEREAEYQADIRRRMELALAGPDERLWQSAKARQGDKPPDYGPLFDRQKWDEMWAKPFDKPELL